MRPSSLSRALALALGRRAAAPPALCRGFAGAGAPPLPPLPPPPPLLQQPAAAPTAPPSRSSAPLLILHQPGSSSSSSSSPSSPAAPAFDGLPGNVRAATLALAARLQEAGIPFAVAGAVACNAHGHRRATQDVDVLVPRERLRDAAEALGGRGWRPRFAGAKRSWRDAERGVDVDLLTSGDFPGDGLPKAVAFPFPDADAAVRTALEGVPVLDLVQLVQLKLASAASAPHRGKDAADVRALVAANGLPWAFATELDVSVRAQFVALWKEVEAARSAGLA